LPAAPARRGSAHRHSQAAVGAAPACSAQHGRACSWGAGGGGGSSERRLLAGRGVLLPGEGSARVAIHPPEEEEMAGTTLVDEKEIVEQLRDWSLQKLKITFVQVVRTCPEHAALVADEIYRRAV